MKVKILDSHKHYQTSYKRKYEAGEVVDYRELAKPQHVYNRDNKNDKKPAEDQAMKTPEVPQQEESKGVKQQNQGI